MALPSLEMVATNTSLRSGLDHDLPQTRRPSCPSISSVKVISRTRGRIGRSLGSRMVRIVPDDGRLERTGPRSLEVGRGLGVSAGGQGERGEGENDWPLHR